MGRKALAAYDPLFSLVLSDDLPKVRGAAASALGKIAKDRAVDQFITELKTNATASAREHAVDALMDLELRDPKAMIPLLEALRDENERVRGRAGIARQFYKDNKLAELLITSLGDKDDPAREWAPWLLGRMKCHGAIAPLHDLLNDDDPTFRKSAVAALRDIKSKESVKPLIKAATQDKNDDVRMRAIQCLGELGDLSASDPLLEFLSDPNPEVRVYAAAAVGTLGVQDATEPLKEMFKHGNPREKLAAIGALCRLQDHSVIPLIIASLDTQPEELLPYLMQGLVELNAETEIRTLGNHKNKMIRSAAQQAAEKLEKRKKKSSKPDAVDGK